MSDRRVLCFCLGILIISSHAIFAGQRRRAVAPPAALPSSAALIDNALAAGSITADQAAMYRVFADFADPRLPAQFHGDDSSITEADSLLDAAAQWPGLSRATQDALAPFFAPPFYVGSWWDLRRVTASAVAPAASPCIPSESGIACPVSGDWKYVAGAHIRVWYQVAHSEDRSIATDLANETDSKIWPEVVRILGREPILNTVIDGKKLLDVALSDGFAPNVLATTFGLHPVTQCAGKGAAYILVSRAAAQAADTGVLHSFFAHEIFHAGQLTFSAAPGTCFKSSKWLIESTATWFEDDLYPGINREHDFAHWYLDAPEKAINDDAYEHARERNYGAYLFFYYLTRVRGLDPTQAVRAVWEAFEKTDSIHALDSAMTKLGAPLDKSWPDFALYAWNEAVPYKLKDGIKDLAILASTRPVIVPFDDVSYEFLAKQIKVPHLSIRYVNFDFPDSTASSIVVYNGLQRALGNQLVSRVGTVITANPVTDAASIKGAHVDALLSIGGTWVHEDWTGQPYRTLCRDLKAERVDSLFVILSNSSVDNDLQVQGKYGPTIQVTNIGCYAWEGSADLRYNEQGSVVDTMKITDLRLEAIGDVPNDANTPLRRMFKIVKGSYSWAVSGVSGACGYSGQLGPQPLASPLDFMYSFPYANTSLAIAGARGVMTDLGLTWAVPQIIVTQMCGKDITKVPWSAEQFLLVTTPDQQAVQIGSDGRSLSIDISKVGLSSKGLTGTWTLNAKRE